MGATVVGKPTAEAADPAQIAPAAFGASTPAMDRALEKQRRAKLSSLLGQLDQQMAARARALPLYRAVVQSDELAPQLRVQRDHPVHTLLRRMYHEHRSGGD